MDPRQTNARGVRAAGAKKSASIRRTDTQSLAPDREMAERFLASLARGDDEPRFTFQTFDDDERRKRSELTKQYHGTLEQCWRWLVARNRQGAGVFVTVNRTDLKGRTKANITAVRAMWADLEEPRDTFPLPPTIIVGSKRGPHAYWLIRGSFVQHELTADQCEEINARIAHRIGSDPAVKDVSRVMRLPGFYHLKDPKAPHLVTLERNCDSDERIYSYEQLCETFPPIPERRKETSSSAGRNFQPAARGGLNKRQQAWLRKTIDGACTDLARVGDGERTSAMFKAACRLCRLENPPTSIAQSNWLGPFIDALRANGLIDDDGSAEINRQLGNAYRIAGGEAYDPIPDWWDKRPTTNSRATGGPSVKSDGDRPTPELLGARFLEEHDVIAVYGQLWVYEAGCYRAGGDKLLRKWVQRALKGLNPKTRDGNETAYWVEHERYVEPSDLDPGGLISVTNGLLDFRTGELHEHSPAYLTLTQLPTTWDPEAYDERADRFLDEVLPDDKTRSVIEEFIGYCLLPDCRFQKALMLTGESGENGKSVLLGWWAAMLGEANISRTSLQDLGHRFRSAAVVGKLANICPDLPREAVKDSGPFKVLAVGEPMQFEQKNKPPFEYLNRAKLAFSANEIPGTRDRSQAFFRRWIIVPFPHRFPEDDPRRDPALPEKLSRPLARSYLLRLAIAGLRRLVARGRFENTPATVAALEEYRRDADSILAFYEDRCEFIAGDPDVWTRKTEVYSKYREWCEASGLACPSEPTVAKRLLAIEPRLKECRPRKVGRERCWRGLRLPTAADWPMNGGPENTSDIPGDF